MPTTSTQKPKSKQKQTQNIVRQIFAEPFEIAKTAGRQVMGGELQTGQQNGAEDRAEQGHPLNSSLNNQEQAATKQKKEARHYQAFQNELQEIRRIQKQREQERLELRRQEEQQRVQQAEKAQKQDTLIEPIARRARGMLGGMVKRKQTQVETQKTPSN